MLVAFLAGTPLAAATQAGAVRLPEWHGDFRHGPASIDRGDSRRQYEFIQTCHSPPRFSTCEGTTDTAIAVVKSPVKDDKYAARHVLVDDGTTRCRRASNTSVKRDKSAATKDGCRDPLFNGRERVQLGGYRYPDGTVKKIANGDFTHDIFYVLFQRWPSGHPGEKWCVFWEAGDDGPSIKCNRKRWRLASGDAARRTCTIVADGTPPLNEWIMFHVIVKWRAAATGFARASMRSLSSRWGGSCALRNVRILEGADERVHPAWGYYRHWAWEHDVAYVLDGARSRQTLGR